eukprot:CAMPEP_0114509456 /NCGR_PEP_ID=MMETSP0109-20121206/13222_1 /TAXON_ID=29199 /ORGANISM="Chlorarachnion reptans, Strain CCCM449" /LENGTH=305 /DNA_ID=CAMNT_0001688615 /DNA_START=37 /DNA_END=951 /DNA_ORIENTATION=-
MITSKADAGPDSSSSNLTAFSQLKEASKSIKDGPEIAGPFREGKFITDSCLQRYLTANNGDVKKALAQLKETVDWRKTYKPWDPCPKCLKNPLAHNLRVVGFDSKGRAVIYTCFSQANDRWDADVNLKHLSWVLEQAVPLMEKRGATKWCWMSDFHGFSTSDCAPKSMMLVKSMLAHYPERLYKAILMDAPWIFNGLWSLVSPLLDQRTKEKVLFCKADKVKDLGKEIDASDELTDFLEAEISDNRILREPPKRYWMVNTNAKEEQKGKTSKMMKCVESVCSSLAYVLKVTGKWVETFSPYKRAS